MNQREPDHWLVRPETIRWIWRISIVILAMTVLLQLVIKVKERPVLTAVTYEDNSVVTRTAIEDRLKSLIAQSDWPVGAFGSVRSMP